ncbi:MAG: hypothetical protein ACREPH_14595 [Rhodanobacteraceae bacterium]
MKLKTLCVAMLLATGGVGIAYATPMNMVNNGDFSTATPPYNGPTQFNDNTGNCGFGSWGGEFVSGWTTNTGGYGIWYPSATAASTVQACTRYGNTGNQFLPAAVTAPPTGSGTFIALDGQSNLETWISQTVSGLTSGAKYTVSFWWASTQEMSRTGATTEQFQVSLGGQSFLTGVNSIGTHGWAPWAHNSFTFTANSASEMLQFLSIGTPANEPPFALLSNVSMTQSVPEPPELALFGGGLLGLGLMTVFARRRALRKQGATGDLA